MKSSLLEFSLRGIETFEILERGSIDRMEMEINILFLPLSSFSPPLSAIVVLLSFFIFSLICLKDVLLGLRICQLCEAFSAVEKVFFLPTYPNE